jgi:hypothetical protein
MVSEVKVLPAVELLPVTLMAFFFEAEGGSLY